MAETESIDPRPSGTSLQVVPVRWNGQARVALIGEIDLGNVHDVEAALTDIASSGITTHLGRGRLVVHRLAGRRDVVPTGETSAPERRITRSREPARSGPARP